MDTMLSRALRDFMSGPLKQLIVNMSGHDADMWERELGTFLRKEPCWTKAPVPQVKKRISVLTFFAKMDLPQTTEKFVAKEKFICDTRAKAKIKIGIISDEFTAAFLLGDGKIENPTIRVQLRCHNLGHSSKDDNTIIGLLGGEKKAEVTLTQMFCLIENQGRGQRGVLLTDGSVNVFYIKDLNGILRSVYVFWCACVWYMFVYPINHSDRYVNAQRVFSCFPG